MSDNQSTRVSGVWDSAAINFCKRHSHKIAGALTFLVPTAAAFCAVPIAAVPVGIGTAVLGWGTAERDTKGAIKLAILLGGFTAVTCAWIDKFANPSLTDPPDAVTDKINNDVCWDFGKKIAVPSGGVTYMVTIDSITNTASANPVTASPTAVQPTHSASLSIAWSFKDYLTGWPMNESWTGDTASRPGLWSEANAKIDRVTIAGQAYTLNCP